MRFDSVADLAGWALQHVRKPDGGLFTRDEMRREMLRMESKGALVLRRYPSGAVSIAEVRRGCL
ncbi:hypothetical protein NK214_06500 [Chromobacterium sp. S0633]|uniref:hypothetical protein n=1 Tax=Chromobacterium sp. S0633 TaxID=2957805 RepID=UPI00209D96B7|nr:hypothetical protein [Chromobacterium sp. S0633]MCP1289839.1 hypothetical protein [Chromobacterium sp. S0633]